MNKRPAQNSILFVTTLSVYLGLVLVGASPQVLAQAAGSCELKQTPRFPEFKKDESNKDLAQATELSVIDPLFAQVCAGNIDACSGKVCSFGQTFSKLVENKKSLVSASSILITTHFARASIDSILKK